jgi:dienelactone hydrolase
LGGPDFLRPAHDLSEEPALPVTYNEPLSEGLQAVLDSVPQTHEISTSETLYESGGVEYGAFRAAPTVGEGPRPAVLIISDWSGLGDHARVRAQMLARLGYIAIAGDVYGGGVHLGPDQAGEQAGRFYGDTTLFRERMKANLEHVRTEPGVDPDRIAVMGYCFGGSASLELARSGAELAGVVSFHGGLQTGAPAEPGAIRSPLLVLTGSADPVVPDEAVHGFEDEMRAAGAEDWQLHTYSGALHAFTMPDANSPEQGAAFDAKANARSWVAMSAFFDEIFA